ncbi:MAG: hypothetical protein IPJ01_06895 [Micavibrio sp.]|nr:hypothetical protein [Micavibrio sp.]MBK9562854.1 hypothetical protein [Micavibrio sp.]
MKEFQGKKIEGEWWLPKEPQVKFKGYLEINENNHGTLTLTEPIDALRKFWPEDLVTIFGVLESSYSYKITIFRAGVKSTSFGNKASVKLFTNTLLISEHIASEDEEIIYAAYGRLTGLSEWCDTSGISGNVDIGAKYGEEKLKLTYKAHATPYWDLGEGKAMRFFSRYYGPIAFTNEKNISFEEQDFIEFTFKNPISITQLSRELGVWQNFLTLSLRRPSHLIEVRFSLEANSEQQYPYALVIPGSRNEDTREYRHVSQILLTRPL